MLKTSVRRVGKSLGITLPKTIVANYHLNEGDELHLIETDDGVVLTPFNPQFAEWVKAVELASWLKKHSSELSHR